MMEKQRKPQEPREAVVDQAHAPGKRRMGPPPIAARAARATPARRTHDQPWVPTSGLVGRTRRSARRS
jgi:hypothetical protein